MQTSNRSTHWPSLLIFILSLVGALSLAGIAVLLAVSGIASLLTGETPYTTQSFALAGSFLLIAALLLPAIYLSFKRMSGHGEIGQEPLVKSLPLESVFGFLILWVTTVALGHWGSQQGQWGWLIMPLANLLAVALPLAFLAAFALQRIPCGPRWRAWGIFAIGLTAGPLIIIIAEVILFALLFSIFLLYVGLTSGMVAAVQDFADLLDTFPSAEAGLTLLEPLLTSPWALLAALFALAVCVPIIEELLKPLGIWLFADHIQSPAEGFALGILSGTAYAVFETLGVSSQLGEGWATLIIARGGTGLLHILTTGLTSWGLVLAWRERRYMFLAGLFALSVFLHATWNAMSVLNVFGTLLAEMPNTVSGLTSVGRASIYALGAQAVFMLILLGVANRLLRARQVSVPEPEATKEGV